MKVFHAWLSLFLLSTACARGTPILEPSPDVSLPSSPAISPSARAWTVVPDGEPHTYTSRATTTLELRTDTGAVRDSFTVITEFGARVEQSEAASRIAGSINRLDRQSHIRALDAEAVAGLPLQFTGRILSGGLVLDSVAGRAIGIVADCENPGLNQMAVVQRNLPVVPLVLRTGMSWTDSSTVATCTGSVPVRLTTVRSYTVLGEGRNSGTPVIALDRTEKITAIGEGAQGQHRIGVQAAGTGSARIFIQPGTGLLELNEGEYRTEVLVRSSGRLQRFVQAVRERTTRTR